MAAVSAPGATNIKVTAVTPFFTTTLAAAANAGDTNIKVASIAAMVAGQTINIDAGAADESRVIQSVGTAGATGTGVTLTAALYQTAPPPPVSAKLLNGDIAYVQLPGFFPGAADQVLGDIATLAPRARLRGLILTRATARHCADPRLLGAFIHGGVDLRLRRAATARHLPAQRPLPHTAGRADRPQLRLGVRRVQRRGEAPATGHPGRHRTAGIVAAPAAAYLLDDASLIILPAKHELSAHHELINGIGVAPDYYLPLTAHDLSTGHDPDIAKALTLLSGR
jgi:carboxyl-terminal processing protease